MKQSQGFNRIMLGGAAALMAIQPAFAAPVQVTAVQLNSTATGVDVVLKTKPGDRPQVFAVNRSNSWTADITSTQLRLPGGNRFQKDNPAPGISRVTVAPLDSNSVRVTVVGKSNSPVGQVVRPSQGGLILSLNSSGAKSAATPVPAMLPRTTVSASALSLSKSPLPPTPGSASQVPGALAQAPAPPPPRQPGPPSPLPPGPGVPLVPNPDVTIQGPGANQPLPVGLPRAVPPPVGDISAAQADATPESIDLGTAERVPRLVLRDAPAREVLALLARAAGLNLAYTGDSALQTTPGQPAPAPGQPGAVSEGPKVTLDIENEAVQDVFNYVLRVSGLEANRVGRTIFVGPRLPNSARSVIVRTLRMNQVPITNALNFLVTMGAESAVSRERLVTSVNAVPVAQLAGGGSGTAITQTQTTTESRIETQRVAFQDSTPILRGLQVSGDERTNQLTLVGAPKLVSIAIAQLTQLDIRRRQVVVNVRVIDVNLIALDRVGTSFSFGVNDTQFINSGGVALLNFGSRTPADNFPNLSAPLQPQQTGSLGVSASNIINGQGLANFARNFFIQLQAAVTNGNAKILTDPTLVVQEGQTATVNLTQEVVTNLTQNIQASQGSTTTTITVEKARAGLILGVKVDRIDDNGFIGLSVAPSISAPENSVNINLPNTAANSITLLSERRLESGQIRLRDGQTLIVSGVIQDQDRTTVTKVPILGDIPILGALFRRTERDHERREVVILLTPRILDDSDRSTFGYSYTPGAATQQILNKGTTR
ncbi:AMIN domain-containing protein [Kovacikia minuta CCNUW1]|uniref:type IV pilus secretin family protein n=1 Tax=Kovacikia minuta TaxID=2931930 RepID=UPI001CCB43AC|nr:type IV pilus secretin family protein [Kovacikia minuta]UBF27646.1 AMIN domain-containing protein [Kovacikia minuta CCNUW1]